MNELTVFKFQGNKEIRTVMVNSDPWFVAKDVAEVLGYTDTATMTRRLDEDEKGMQNLQTLGGMQNMAIINESGLYNAVIGSNKPEAKAFKKWVTSEVLPSIRKTGSYSKPEFYIPKTYSDALRLCADQSEQIDSQRADLALMSPKAEYFDAVTSSKDAIHMNNVAKIIDVPAMGRNNLFAFLRDEEILMENNQPYQEFVDKKHFRVVQSSYQNSKGETKVTFTTMVYQKGIQLILKRLEDKGMAPRKTA